MIDKINPYVNNNQDLTLNNKNSSLFVFEDVKNYLFIKTKGFTSWCQEI